MKNPLIPCPDIIALGALTYRDVWDGNVIDDRRELDVFLRLRVFRIDHRLNFEGNDAFLLTPVARGCPDLIGHVSSNLRILEPYWLG